MRTVRPTYLLGAFLLACGPILAMGTASAEEPVGARTFDSAEACMQSGSADHMPVCLSSNGGTWVADFGSSHSVSVGSGAFGAFILFAILWAAAPAVIGGFVASSRGQSVGIAVLLCILLGWLGLLIVALVMKPNVTAAARNIVDSASRPDWGQTPASGSRASAVSRLKELDELRAQNMITADEYASRRAEILREI